MQQVNTFLSSHWFNRLLFGLILLFPVVAASVKSGGSTIFALLFILSLASVRSGWSKLGDWEKRVLLGFVVFVAWLLITMVNTDDFSSAARKLERFIRLLAIIPIYIMLRRHDSNNLAQAFLIGSVLGCFVLAAQAWYFFNIAGQVNVNGVYHKIIFGDTAVLLVSIVTISLFSSGINTVKYFVGVLAILAGLYAAVLSGSRGAWLLLPLLLGLWIWLYRSRISRKVWVSLTLATAGLICLLLVWTPKLIVDGIQHGLDDLKTYRVDPSIETSFGARLNMWRDSLTLFKQHPIVGVGVGDFKYDRQILMDSGKTVKGYAWGHAHSIYFHALATTGLLGLLIMLFCLFLLPLYVFYQAWLKADNANSKFVTLAGISVLVAFAVFGLSETWLARSPFVNLYAVSLVVFMSALFSRQRVPIKQ